MEELRTRINDHDRRIRLLENDLVRQEANYINMEKKLDSANQKLDELIQTQHEKAEATIDTIVKTIIAGVVGAIIAAGMAGLLK